MEKKTVGKRPTREEVAKRTLIRMKRFTEAIESEGKISDTYTCKKVILNIEVRRYGADEVKEVRGILNLSQALFAQFLNVSLSALHKWERGVQSPDGAACRLMDEIRSQPDYWKKRFRSMARIVSSDK